MKTSFPRRRFLQGLSGAFAVSDVNLLFGVRVVQAMGAPKRGKKKRRLKAYIRSGRTKEGLSKASLKHCHRFIYATKREAKISLAHPGDCAEVKERYITLENYRKLFLKPHTRKARLADLNS